MVKTHSWKDFISQEQSKDYYQELVSKIDSDKEKNTVYPEAQNIFKAFKLCPYEQTNVLILGQDPYINEGPEGPQAQGLSFSVPTGMALPPSLRNIFKELKSDLQIDNGKNGNLTPWAEQGVLLLNSVLTVRKGESNSHKDYGWIRFTDSAISLLNEKESPVIFVLWGSYAGAKSSLIDTSKHLVIKSPHPSPMSASSGFFGSKPFSQVNDFLLANNQKQIDWKT